MQDALEACPDGEARVALASELRGHVWEAIRCPHANYVVQKCISMMPPQACQFIIDELLRRGTGAVASAARHRFGCRILERLLERCSQLQARPLVDDLISDAVALSSHPYGNYVVQHVLEHGPPDQQRRLCGLLGRHVATLGPDGYASAVVAKALSHGSKETRLLVARHVASSPGLVAQMARTRHGHLAVKLVLQLLEDFPQERDAACKELEADVSGLRASRYGRFVASSLEGQRGGGRSGFSDGGAHGTRDWHGGQLARHAVGGA